jgi:hypothetical protein
MRRPGRGLNGACKAQHRFAASASEAFKLVPSRERFDSDHRSILQVVHSSAAMPKRIVPKLFGHQKLGTQPED